MRPHSLLIAAFLLVASTAPAAVAASPDSNLAPEITPYEAPSWLELVLPGALAGDDDEGGARALRLVLSIRDGQATGGYGQAQGSERRRGLRVLDAATDGRSLTGRLVLLRYGQAAVPFTTAVVSLQGTTTSGSFSLGYAGDDPEAAKAFSAIKGSYQARLYEDADWRARLPAVTGSYDGWRNDGTGSGTPSHQELVEDVADVRLLWSSEAVIPPVCNDSTGFRWSFLGGAGTCALADGKVVFFASRGNPDGPVSQDLAKDKLFDTKRNQMNNNRPRHPDLFESYKNERMAVFGDDLVWCIDARTGATLWRTRFPFASGNWSLFTGKPRGLLHTTPRIHGAKVYVLRSLERLSCLDLESGRVLWQQALNEGRVQSYREKRQDFLASWSEDDGTIDGNDNEPTTSPVVAGPVVACFGTNQALTGFDAETGRKLWGPVEGSKNQNESPSAWHFNGTDYFLTTCALIEARTGRVCWTVPHGSGGSHVVTGDIMVHNAPQQKTAEGHPYVPLQAWRLHPEGRKLLWTFDKGGTRGGSPVISDGKLYLHVGNDQHRDGRGSHFFYCLDLETGQELAAIPFSDNGWISLTGAHGPILSYMGTLLSSDPANFRILGELPGDWVPCSTSLMTDGRLLLRAPDAIVCYDLRRPQR